MSAWPKEVSVGGNASINWEYPKIGTCGDDVEKLSINIARVRVVPDIQIGFDGVREGFTVGAESPDGKYVELAFISEDSIWPIIDAQDSPVGESKENPLDYIKDALDWAIGLEDGMPKENIVQKLEIAIALLEGKK